MSLVDDYTAQALARLRFYVDPPSEDPNDDEYIPPEVLGQEAEGYARQLIEQHELELETWADSVEVDEEGDPVSPQPDLLGDELAAVSRTITALETYRKSLLAFGDRYAATDYSQRDLARLARVNHATVSRWLSDPQVHAKVRTAIGPLAAWMAEQIDLSSLANSPDGPRVAAFYGRLLLAAAPETPRAKTVAAVATQPAEEAHDVE